MDVSRRDLLRLAGGIGLTGLAGGLVLGEDSGAPPDLGHGVFFDKEARWYEKLGDGKVRCGLCPHNCVVSPGNRGACGVRENRDGVYKTLVWGNPCAIHVDPIEKKPLFHFHPGANAFSLATAGCNLRCKFCQNWDISQVRPEETPNVKLAPEDVVRAAREAKTDIIAFTYSEPTVFSEYVLDTARLARSEKLDTVTISNGFIEKAPHEELLAVLSAIKIDLKSFDDKFYTEITAGKLAPVLATLERLAEKKTWFEIVYLVIPSLNDDLSKIKDMSRWIHKSLGLNVPLHFTAFHPSYKLKNLPVTPPSTVRAARDTALSEGLKFVYCGNIPGDPGENTFCPSCRKVVVGRYGYFVMEKHLKDVSREMKEAKCEYCGESIPGIW
jgi:pyruvate formate lyase activating enzyme